MEGDGNIDNPLKEIENEKESVQSQWSEKVKVVNLNTIRMLLMILFMEV